MTIYIDQLNRKITLQEPARRIISLVPSQTELLYDLGLNKEVLGITKFCVHPENWKAEKDLVGGTKNLNIEKIKSLNPDLVIANKEENEEQQVVELAKYFPVWISDIHNLEDAIQMIEELGKLCGRTEIAKSIFNTIQKEFDSLIQRNNKGKTRVLYLIWRDPYLSVGNDTFIHDMLTKCGFQNCAENYTRYPELSVEQIATLKPEHIFLSSEPYPFSKKHMQELSKLFPESGIHLVDGEMFSWYGSHLLKAPYYFKSMLKEVNSPS